MPCADPNLPSTLTPGTDASVGAAPPSHPHRAHATAVERRRHQLHDMIATVSVVAFAAFVFFLVPPPPVA
jgi:hypothetical protein